MAATEQLGLLRHPYCLLGDGGFLGMPMHLTRGSRVSHFHQAHPARTTQSLSPSSPFWTKTRWRWIHKLPSQAPACALPHQKGPPGEKFH